jgi:hypothetical protein
LGKQRVSLFPCANLGFFTERFIFNEFFLKNSQNLTSGITALISTLLVNPLEQSRPAADASRADV